MRSRLETLWARVFDAMNLKWIYEPTIEFASTCSENYIPDFLLVDLGVLVEVKPTVSHLDELKDHPEVMRAARCCGSINMPLLAVGQSYVYWWIDADAVLLGFTFHPDLIGAGTGYLQLMPGTKRHVTFVIAGDWDGSRNVTEWECSFWRDHDIPMPNGPAFPDLWNHCVNANQWQPKRRIP